MATKTQSFLASTMAPTMAARRTNESAQNGMRYGPKMESLTLCTDWMAGSVGSLSSLKASIRT